MWQERQRLSVRDEIPWRRAGDRRNADIDLEDLN
jgi:hypothetical protein